MTFAHHRLCTLPRLYGVTIEFLMRTLRSPANHHPIVFHAASL